MYLKLPFDVHGLLMSLIYLSLTKAKYQGTAFNFSSI